MQQKYLRIPMTVKRTIDQEPSKKVLITDFFGTKGVNQVVRDVIVKKSKNQASSQIEEIKDVQLELKVLEEAVKITESPEIVANVESANSKNGFDKDQWIKSLSEDQLNLLQLEIDTLHISWLAHLHKELTKPYFLELKRYLQSEFKNKTTFPPQEHIYSWSHYTPLENIKCLVIGQDPYHNVNQAHGLAFSVLEPTRPPPSLINIYKTITIDYPNFITPDFKVLNKKGGPGGGGNLTLWAKRGVLMLNACLTVEAHKPNSHKGHGWKLFTEEVIKVALNHHQNSGFVVMAWGAPAQNRIDKFSKLLQRNEKYLVLRTVHPSPLSARRGFFELNVFKKCNEWLEKIARGKIDWGLEEKNVVT